MQIVNFPTRKVVWFNFLSTFLDQRKSTFHNATPFQRSNEFRLSSAMYRPVRANIWQKKRHRIQSSLLKYPLLLTDRPSKQARFVSVLYQSNLDNGNFYCGHGTRRAMRLGCVSCTFFLSKEPAMLRIGSLWFSAASSVSLSNLE